MFKIKEIHPMFNQVVTTKDMYKDVLTNSGLVDTSKTNHLKEYQTVVAVGPAVKDIKKGDVVFINPKRYMKMTHKDGIKDLDRNVIKDDMHISLDIPSVELYDRPDGSCREVLLIYDSDVIFVAKGEEFDENPTVYRDPNPIIYH